MIEIGKINRLVVAEETSSGYFLTEKDSDEEVFMPPAMAPAIVKINQELDVFVYMDNSGSLLATSEIPDGQVGEYALLKVAEITDFGAFMDWGISKDLLVPGNEQKTKIRQYDQCIVRICIEENTNRIFGTTKLGKFIQNAEFEIKSGEQVKITVCQKTPLGYKVIINKLYIGMIYHNEIFTNVHTGQTYDGIVKKLRNDGLVDAALQAQGVDNLIDAKDKILNLLSSNNGRSPLNDKSSPVEIKKALGISKQSFKRAIGMLYKERKIIISKDGIKLT